MRSIVLNELEFEALAGMSHLQFRLYVLLRWAMDVATRQVGLKSSISLGWMARELEVYPIPGRHADECGAPTTKAVRNALLALEKKRLVEPCGNGEVSVFLLPMSSRALARPKEQGQGRGKEEGQSRGKVKSSIDAGFGGGDGAGWARGDGIGGATLRYQVNPIAIETAATALPVIPRKKLSTGEVLPLLLSDPLPSDLAAWLVAMEGRRGKRVMVSASDPKLAKWHAEGVTADEVMEAYRLAVAARECDKSTFPLNPGFLDIFVGRVVGERRFCKGVPAGSSLPAPAWHATDEGVQRQAAALGIDPQRDGEDAAAFKSRVSFEHAQRTAKPVARRHAPAKGVDRVEA